MQIEQPSKILRDNINIIKTEGDKEYAEDSSKLIESIKNDILIFIDKSKSSQEKLNTGTYVNEGFSWNSKVATKSHLTSLITKSSDSKKTAFSDSSLYDNCEQIDSNKLIAESAFGSYCDEIDCIKSEKDINNTLINKIDCRRQSVMKTVNTQSFNRKRDSKFVQMLMRLVFEEMNLSSINHNNDRVAGWQSVCSLEESEINEKPFETLKQLSSTRGRLFVLRNWDRIIRHPNFAIQNILKDSYGISIGKNRSELNTHCPSNWVSKKVRDRKLEVLPKIRRKILEIAEKLEQSLKWRILIEKYLRKLQDSGYKFECDVQISEEMYYQMLLNSIYIYQLINNLSYDQEKELRVRLFCECPKKHKHDNSKEDFCICLYGLDAFTQMHMIRGIINKEEIIKEEIEKYFDYDGLMKGYKIKKDKRAKFNKYVDKETIYGDLNRDVEEILNIHLLN